MDRRNIKNIRIIKRLLESPDGSWTMYGLSKVSGASQPFGWKLVHSLVAKGLLSGTKVIDIEGLARYAAKLLPKPRSMTEFYVPEPVKFLRKNVKNYALTTYFGENLVTHHLFPTRCDAYILEADLKRLKPMIFKEGLLGKGNIRLMVPVDTNIIDEARRIRGTLVVSQGQLLIDLVREGGVCMEAFEMMVSQHVRKE